VEPTFWAFVLGCAWFILCIGGAVGLIIFCLCFWDHMVEDHKHKRTICMAWDETLNAMMDSGLPVTDYSYNVVRIGGANVSVDPDNNLRWYGSSSSNRMGCSRATQQRLRDYIARSRCIEILKKAEKEQERHANNTSNKDC
jgi:hypothetical protein